MKPIIYFILLIFFCKMISAQKSFPLKQDNPNWKIVNTVTNYPETKTTKLYQFEKDTFINSMLYQKISYDAGYVRVIDSKIYYRLKKSGKDFLLYNFNLNTNDTVYCGFNLNENDNADTIKFWVIQVDSVEIENGKHKRLKMNYNPMSDYIASMDWIEGIGSTIHPFYPSITLNLPGGYSELLCYFLGTTKVYQNPLYVDCEITTSNKEIQKKNEIIVYPNPFSNTLIVKNTQPNSILKVYNSQGQFISAYFLDNSENKIQIDKWTSGIYLIMIEINNILVFNQTIIKQ